MKNKRVGLGLLALTLLLSGCGAAGELPPETTPPLSQQSPGEALPNASPAPTPRPEADAETLYALKTPYVGDAAACGAILAALGLEELGEYQLSLQTEKEPYGLTVHLTPHEGRTPEELDAEFCRRGYLFLALVDNAQRFAWEYASGDGLRQRYVDDRFQVKPYGESAEAFAELWAVAELLGQAEQWPADVLISSGSEAYVMRGADPATISALWAGVKSLTLTPTEDSPGQDDALNLVFYDSKGGVLAAYSFYGGYCRTGGPTLYKAQSDSFSYRQVRWFYEFSRISEVYVQGVYTPGT